jgi:hypothetical protein
MKRELFSVLSLTLSIPYIYEKHLQYGKEYSRKRTANKDTSLGMPHQGYLLEEYNVA